MRPTESVMENAVKCRALAGYVAQRCRIEIPERQVNGTISPEDFSGGMLAFRNAHRAAEWAVMHSDEQEACVQEER